MIVPAVQPDVQAIYAPMRRGDRLQGFSDKRGGHDQTVWLHRTVEPRSKSPHDQPGGARPGRSAIAKLNCPRDACREQSVSDSHFIALVKLVIAKRPIDRFLENLHVR